MKIAKGKNPLQFVSHFINMYPGPFQEVTYQCLPISMDASSSAYQIMSYFL